MYTEWLFNTRTGIYTLISLYGFFLLIYLIAGFCKGTNKHYYIIECPVCNNQMVIETEVHNLDFNLVEVK